MRKFILTMPLRKKMDPYGMLGSSIEKELKVFCGSIKQLRETLSVLTPKGYKVPSSSWLGTIFKLHNKIYLCSPHYNNGTKVIEIQEVEQKPTISSVIKFTNSWGVKIRLYVIGLKHKGEAKSVSPNVPNIVLGPTAKMLKKQPTQFEILKN